MVKPRINLFIENKNEEFINFLEQNELELFFEAEENFDFAIIVGGFNYFKEVYRKVNCERSHIVYLANNDSKFEYISKRVSVTFRSDFYRDNIYSKLFLNIVKQETFLHVEDELGISNSEILEVKILNFQKLGQYEDLIINKVSKENFVIPPIKKFISDAVYLFSYYIQEKSSSWPIEVEFCFFEDLFFIKFYSSIRGLNRELLDHSFKFTEEAKEEQKLISNIVNFSEYSSFQYIEELDKFSIFGLFRKVRNSNAENQFSIQNILEKNQVERKLEINIKRYLLDDFEFDDNAYINGSGIKVDIKKLISPKMNRLFNICKMIFDFSGQTKKPIELDDIQKDDVLNILTSIPEVQKFGDVSEKDLEDLQFLLSDKEGLESILNKLKEIKSKIKKDDSKRNQFEKKCIDEFRIDLNKKFDKDVFEAQLVEYKNSLKKRCDDEKLQDVKEEELQKISKELSVHAIKEFKVPDPNALKKLLLVTNNLMEEFIEDKDQEAFISSWMEELKFILDESILERQNGLIEKFIGELSSSLKDLDFSKKIEDEFKKITISNEVNLYPFKIKNPTEYSKDYIKEIYYNLLSEEVSIYEESKLLKDFQVRSKITNEEIEKLDLEELLNNIKNKEKLIEKLSFLIEKLRDKFPDDEDIQSYQKMMEKIESTDSNSEISSRDHLQEIEELGLSESDLSKVREIIRNTESRAKKEIEKKEKEKDLWKNKALKLAEENKFTKEESSVKQNDEQVKHLELESKKMIHEHKNELREKDKLIKKEEMKVKELEDKLKKETESKNNTKDKGKSFTQADITRLNHQHQNDLREKEKAFKRSEMKIKELEHKLKMSEKLIKEKGNIESKKSEGNEAKFKAKISKLEKILENKEKQKKKIENLNMDTRKQMAKMKQEMNGLKNKNDNLQKEIEKYRKKMTPGGRKAS